MVRGGIRAAGGIASGNFVAVARGATEILSPKVAAIILAAVLFFTLLPIIVISAIPQMLFSWGTVNDAELILRNRHGARLTECYMETIADLPEGAEPDFYWLVSIESVRSKQRVESVTESDIIRSVENSFAIDEETGEVYNKSADEIMAELGFSEEEKNWATLMYNSLNDQYLDPDSEYADAGGLESYEGVTLGAADFAHILCVF